jgi:exopolyphosphatase/guanosine-5'-triphosphate,3'-diphosphate pyrophosphatase
MRIAVIDLGTNTCNLLIAELFEGNFEILHQSKQLVKLGDGKIKDNEISTEATQRTIDSFLSHKKYIQDFGAEQIRVIATSAVRTAENKVLYLEKLGDESGWLVKLVSGEKEAELIFKGVLLALKKLSKPSVILDIGGGSNELILAHEKELLWKESQPTGMARIINSFQISNPILPVEIETLQNYFIEQHIQAIKNCKEKSVETLIGCSGAFDTIADLIDGVSPGVKARITQKITLNDFYKVFKLLVISTRKERLQMTGMDNVRVDLIVPAVILIESLITQIGIQQIVQTDFALREGVLSEMMDNQLKLQPAR